MRKEIVKQGIAMNLFQRGDVEKEHTSNVNIVANILAGDGFTVNILSKRSR
jgi:hypothetical protein